MPKLETEYPRQKSFNLTDQDFSNLKQVAENYGVSDSAVIRLGLHKVYEENGLPVDGDSAWYTEEDATDRLVERLVPKLVEALRNG